MMLEYLAVRRLSYTMSRTSLGSFEKVDEWYDDSAAADADDADIENFFGPGARSSI